MSKLVKGVKKVFKKVTSVVKKAVKFVAKNWKTIALGVAVYFTAGVALSAFPATAGFASSMPGFGVGGTFSKAAAWMGFSGAEGSGIAGTIAAKAGESAIPSYLVEGAKDFVGPSASLANKAVSSTTTALMPTKAGGIFSGMSGIEKLMTLQMVTNFAGNLMSDSENDIRRKDHERKYGNMMGIGRDGKGPGTQGVFDSWANNDVQQGSGGNFLQPSTESYVPEGSSNTPFESGPPPKVDEFNNSKAMAQQGTKGRDFINQGLKTGDYMPYGGAA